MPVPSMEPPSAKGVVWILCVCLAYVTTASACIVNAPSVVRVGAEETAVIFNRESERNVTLTLQDYPARLHTIHRESFILGAGESRLVRMHIDPHKLSAEEIRSGQRRYLSLVAECGRDYKKEARLLISDKSGYLLLQSDKPIYTPKQTVHLRMIAVGEDLVPSNGSLKLEIKNPQNIVTYQTVLSTKDNASSTGMFSHSYSFPELAMIGQWKAVVTYGSYFTQETEVPFELQEYVLPTFSVTLTVPSVILTEQDFVEGELEAKYVYGKPVEGSATFKFKIRNEGGKDTEHGSTSYKELAFGKARFRISIEDLKMVRRKRWSPLVHGNRFVVEADVLDKATSKRVTAVDDSAVFATSPYLVGFRHTPKDFKPGTVTVVVADIKHLNGKPAPGIRCEVSVLNDQELDVHVDATQSVTDATGRVAFLVQTERHYTRLKVKVQTRDPKYRSHQQAEGKISIEPYNSPVRAFVSLQRMDTTKSFKVGDYFDSTVISEPADISPIYYLVTHRGQTKTYGALNDVGSAPQRSVHFRITRDLSPTVRVLVYAFYRGHILADSLTIDIEEACSESSTVRIEPEFQNDLPGTNGSLKVVGTAGTRVGILGVDKAVYILNNKGLLTREKLFTTLKSHDLGCGPGGGMTSEEVISNFGVVVISEEVTENILRTENSCEARVRRRRNVHSRAQGQYNRDPFLKECCALGLKRDRMGRRCATRSYIVQRYLPGERGERCAKAFQDCCLSATGRPGVSMGSGSFPSNFNVEVDEYDDSRTRMGSNNAYDETYDEVDGEQSPETVVRKDFRETWLFDEQVIGPNGVADFAVSLPHSITTWSVQAVSVSPTGGVCVPKPEDVRVFQPIFLQVALPYKVVRNEQIEVLVTVYNYGSEPLMGNAYIYGVEGLCTGAMPGERSERRHVKVPANSASSVTFPVVPLREGLFTIKIYVRSSMGEDVVEKELNVVPEGVVVSKSFSVSIDPSNTRRRTTRSVKREFYQDSLDPGANLQVISVNTRLPPDALPDTRTCSLSMIGNQLGPSVQTTLENLEALITMPRGCGEQNMMLMAPTLYALDYLKQNNLLDEELEEKGYRYIREGYERELSFRKTDGSFSAFKHRESSVWLTAFVMRIFCKARRYASIDPNVIESGMLWLAAAQKLDGSFREQKPIMHKIMLGGVRGAVPMTAFVLLTFIECKQSVGRKNDVQDAYSPQSNAIMLRTMDSAQQYLRDHALDSSEPYVAALAAYALSKAEDTEKHAALSALKEKLIYDRMLSTRSTGTEGSPVVVEGTGYALLALLAHNDLETSKTVVNWLNMHRSASGSFSSTQDTVVALHALTEFALKVREPNVDLTCNVTLSSHRNFQRSIRLKRDNAAILQQLDIHNASSKMFVKASGTGSGLLSVTLKYNVLVPPELLCKFNITVRADVHTSRKDSVRTIGFPEDLLKDLLGEGSRRRRSTRLSWFGGASESRRRDSPAAPFFPDGLDGRGNSATTIPVEALQQSKLIYDIEVCSRYIEGEDSNMAVMEVGLFSGFEPIEKDLEAARNDNPLLAKYDITEKNVILYFDKIPWEEQTCVKFRIERKHVVYNVQSAIVKVYDYYNPMHSCTQFYGPGSTSPLLKLICEGNQCECAEADCPRKEPFLDVERQGATLKKREKLMELACKQHDFVWVGTVSSNTVNNGYRHIKFRIDTVIKEGAENSSSVMTGLKVFVARELCKTADLHVQSRYFVFGRDSDPFERDDIVEMRYTLDKDVRLFNTNTADLHTPRSRASRLNSVLQWFMSGFSRQGCPP